MAGLEGAEWKVAAILAFFAILFLVRSLGGGKPYLPIRRRRRVRDRER